MGETAYARAIAAEKRRKRKAQREKNLKQGALSNGGLTCGAERRKGGPCGLPAGHQTDHPGIGRCKWHGGNAPLHKLNSVTQEAIFMGAPKDVNPVEAMTWCIHITAGEIEWYSERIAELDEADWFEQSVIGKQMNVLVRERANAVTRLAKFSKDAIALGIAERAVRLAESYGAALARLLKGVIEDLELTPKQREIAPAVIRKHLILMERAQPSPPAIPEKVA